MDLAPYRYALLLHRLKQGGLGLGRRAVDLIGQHDVGEDGSPLEIEERFSQPIFGQDIGSGDVRGHEIGRKLNPGKAQIQDLAETAHHERLAQSGHPFQETVAAADERHKNMLDEIFVSDDSPAQLRLQLVKGAAASRHSLLNFFQSFHRDSVVSALSSQRSAFSSTIKGIPVFAES